LFVNLSKSEGISQSIMEAISYGIPCIATHVGGTPEIVVNDVSGYLVKPSDSSTTISKVIFNFNKLTNKEKIKLRKSTRSYWEKMFNSNVNIKKFIKELRGE